MSKVINKRLLVTDTKPETFAKISKVIDLIASQIEKNGKGFALLFTNDESKVRSDAQNKLLQCYYTEITKSDWAKNISDSTRVGIITYCKRYIIIDVLRAQAVIDSEAGFKALEKISAVDALRYANKSESIRVAYLQTDGWSSILDTDHFKMYLKEIELHFLDKLNYRLESINEQKRRDAFS